MKKSEKVVVLFSGGRDSSAAAVEMAREGYDVALFTFQAGLPELTGERGDSAPDIRHRELTKSFPENIDKNRIITGSTYLIKKLAIDKTNKRHVVYPIALALAFHSDAILFCIKNNIKDITCGYSGYQAKEDRYIEQRKDFFELMKNFLAEYGINYHAPVINKSKEGVIDILEKNGISSNSLENKSIFGAIPFDVDKSLDFWNESIVECREYIKYMKN